MGGFELLEHTADVRVVATGQSLAEALSWVATATFSVIVDLATVEARESIQVDVASTDAQTLTVDWLNELLFRYETEGFILKEFRLAVNGAGTSLWARCMGEPVDKGRHGMLTEVKAATYHALEVSYNGQWRVQVVLDV